MWFVQIRKYKATIKNERNAFICEKYLGKNHGFYPPKQQNKRIMLNGRHFLRKKEKKRKIDRCPAYVKL